MFSSRYSHTLPRHTEGNDVMLTGTPEYMNALAQERYHRHARTAPPRRMLGRRALDLPGRLLPRGSVRDERTRAA